MKVAIKELAIQGASPAVIATSRELSPPYFVNWQPNSVTPTLGLKKLPPPSDTAIANSRESPLDRRV